MSPLEPEVPPVGEEIHLPAPTVVPALTAIGITLTLGCAVSWVRRSRADVDELPLD